jgi:putative sugar O-methyltransferase
MSFDDPVLAEMIADYRRLQGVYAPSKFWERLNEFNLAWLRNYGFDRFKQTVNNNYFNWIINPWSRLFRDAVHSLRQRGGKALAFMARALRLELANGSVCLMTAPERPLEPMGWWRSLFYRTYILMLEAIADHECAPWPELSGLSEPLLGTPLHILRDGRVVTQDLSNSRLELAAIRKALDPVGLPRAGHVAELGAGYGRLIYVILRIGYGSKCTIIDIPPALYLSQRYLTEVFPGEKAFRYRDFLTYGEVKDEFESSRLRFLMPHQIEMIPDRSIDLLVNVSSLQEMTREQIGHYFRIIGKKARYFYTKQWSSWRNPVDGIVTCLADYPIPPGWKTLYLGTPVTNRAFFEAVYAIS